MKHTGENGYSDSSDDGEAGGTEELKARDQMAWVRVVNGIRNMAEEQRMFELKQRKKREKC